MSSETDRPCRLTIREHDLRGTLLATWTYGDSELIRAVPGNLDDAGLTWEHITGCPSPIFKLTVNIDVSALEPETWRGASCDLVLI